MPLSQSSSGDEPIFALEATGEVVLENGQQRQYIHLVSDEGKLSLKEAFERHSSYVARLALRLMGRRSDAEDLVQDVFVQATGGLSAIRDPNAIRRWLATITVRLARRRLRARSLLRWLGLDGAEDRGAWELVDRSASPSDRALLSSVYELLAECAPLDRLAWVLHHVEGERLMEVSALLGCSLATTKRRIARVQASIDVRFADE